MPTHQELFINFLVNMASQDGSGYNLRVGYIKLQEDDLQEVARELELTPKQIKDLEEYGSNFLMIQTPEGFLCTSSSWESWVHDENTDFILGLHSIWDGGVEEVRENKPFQICIDNRWMGTLPYSKQLVEKLNVEEKRLHTIAESEAKRRNAIIASISGRVIGEVSKALNTCI